MLLLISALADYSAACQPDLLCQGDSQSSLQQQKTSCLGKQFNNSRVRAKEKNLKLWQEVQKILVTHHTTIHMTDLEENTTFSIQGCHLS